MSERSRKRRYLRTAEVAREVGVHPNTVRLYESWGFLPPIPRGRNGYRLFTEEHLDLMRLARTALQFPYPGGKGPVLGLVERAKRGDLDGAIALAEQYLDQVRAERARSEGAVAVLERWARRGTACQGSQKLWIGRAARQLGTTIDALRNWERNGLLAVSRDPSSGYRSYGPAEMDRLSVIRLLRSAGYSTMAILRTLRHLDEGGVDDLRNVLGTMPPDEDIFYFTDRWLSTLAEQEKRALDVISQLQAMILKRQ